MWTRARLIETLKKFYKSRLSKRNENEFTCIDCLRMKKRKEVTMRISKHDNGENEDFIVCLHNRYTNAKKNIKTNDTTRTGMTHRDHYTKDKLSRQAFAFSAR